MADSQNTEVFLCNICEGKFPAENFYKSRNRIKHCCKKCHKEKYGNPSVERKKLRHREKRGIFFKRRKEFLICQLYKVCIDCKQEKSWFDLKNSENGKSSLCLECHRIRAKKRYAANPEKDKQRMLEYRARLKAEGRAKDFNRKARKAQRARYLAAGLTTNGTPRKAQPLPPGALSQGKLQRQGIEFRKWLRHWLTSAAPEPCVAAWYATTDKPWNNPRLDVGQKFRVRYNADHEFRAKEILKSQLRKESRAKRIDELSDGSVTPQALGAMFGEAKYCVYCVEPFKDSYEKTADHVQPLYLGGAHSLDNLVICCRSCNSKKGKKGFLQWLTEAKPISNWLV